MPGTFDRLVSETVDTAVDRAVSKMTPVFQQHVADAGWDQTPKLEHTKGVVSARAYKVGEAEDLEWGTHSTAPKPAIHTFFNNKSLMEDMDAIVVDGMRPIFDTIWKMFR